MARHSGDPGSYADLNTNRVSFCLITWAATFLEPVSRPFKSKLVKTKFVVAMDHLPDMQKAQSRTWRNNEKQPA